MAFQRIHATKDLRGRRKRGFWIALIAGSIALALAPAGSEGLLQNGYPHIPPEMTRIPDRNQANDINGPQTQKQSYEAANAARKKQIAQDSASLLKLATDLKAEVDKTNKDTLSLSVIRKADEIEKLAHNIKEKMKLSVGAD
jgi:hypothetical protein